jgi:5'-phosphate synthase pdxT subunit
MNVNILPNITVGVLAIQGDYERHVVQLKALGVTSREVRLARDLEGLSALILPGGESTTIDKMLDRFSMRQPLVDFCRTKPVYGTCAGMILLCAKINDNQSSVKPLNAIDIAVLRNGYGRQVFSFGEKLDISLGNGTKLIEASFIRAPKITAVGKDVFVIGRRGDDPVLVRNRNVLAASFHNELGDDTSILRFFLGHFLG